MLSEFISWRVLNIFYLPCQVLIEVRRAHWVRSVYLVTDTTMGTQPISEDSVAAPIPDPLVLCDISVSLLALTRYSSAWMMQLRGINITRAVVDDSATGVTVHIQEARAMVEAAFPGLLCEGDGVVRPVYFIGGPVMPARALALCIVKSQGGAEALVAMREEAEVIFELSDGMRECLLFGT